MPVEVTDWNPSQTGEYSWRSAGHSDSHSYLLPSIRHLTADISAGARVMDFGCGNGSMLAFLSDCGWHLSGVDFSLSGIELARRSYPSIDFQVGDVSDPEFDHPLIGQFDLVISTEVVEHLYLPRHFARNCFRLLKPDGILVVSTPYHGYLKNIVLSLSGQMDHHWHALWDYGHIKFWSRKTLSALFDEAGFDVTQFHGSGRLPYLWKSMFLKCRKKSWS
jgi:2-polyprenyl-6-hydroxyphenyl methylase/3-demethylubiquinone-9 3-methyltransferase